MRQTLIRALRRVARPLGIVLIIAAAFYHAALGLYAPPMLERLDALLYDLRFRLALAPPPPAHKIVIVDIDERSQEAEGRWPWSRVKMGHMLSELYGSGVVITGFDVTFPEPERNPVDEVLTDRTVASQVGGLLRAERRRFDADTIFSRDVAKGETVLGFFLHNDSATTIGALPPPMFTLAPEERDVLMVPEFIGYAGNRPVIQEAAAGAGSLSTQPDVDGVVRRSPMIYRVGDDLYPSLSLEIARRFLVVDHIALETAMQNDTVVIEAITVGNSRIPTDAGGRAVVPYRGGAKSFPYIPATDVIRGTLTPEQREQLQGAIVLVGTSALGLKDLRSTPLGTNYPGVEVHANLLDAILGSTPPETRFWHRPDYEIGATVVIIALIGLMIVLVQPKLGAGGQLLFSLLTIGIVIGSNYLLWIYAKIDFPLSPPLVTIVALNALFMVLGFLEETQRRAQIHNMFGQYVAPVHINRLLEHPEQVSFEGESKEMTVLFSDVRSFTTISEKLSAQELKQLLNRYFTPITKIIFDNHGTIDKYVGDMVMAFWGAPLDDDRHAEHAVDAALAMLQKVNELKEQFGAEGLPRIDVGIGINSGPMNVGDMGSSYRRAYTVLGDAVNLGSRLESATKQYGLRLLVGETTAAQCPDHLLRLIDRLQVKGKTEPVKVYEPLCRLREATPQQIASLERWHRALDHYFGQRWSDAENELGELLALEPECKLYGIFLERIAALRAAPPAADWDGVYVLKEK
ncbi:MAG: CHASE2 domain-containing protein [Pseudomonadota bacterium]